jgi:hypothetical protein
MELAALEITQIEELEEVEREEVLDWLERADRNGLDMDLEELRVILEQAPASAHKTAEYHYLRGYYDCKFLKEEIA